jgi:hypothetical protein
MLLIALQPKATPRLQASVAKSADKALANCCPIAQAIECALELAFRNKISNVGVLRDPGLKTSLGTEVA